MRGRANGQNLDGRRGAVFALRMTDEERRTLFALFERDRGPRAFGPWLLWRAAGARSAPGTTGAIARRVLPARAEPPAVIPVQVVPKHKRVILDLCAGTGAWSEPYRRAGYKVVRVTLPRLDVRTWVPPKGRVWGVLAAPPCTEFSLVRNGSRKPRDYVEAMATVNACLRIVLLTRPTWWALENPVGKLSMFLGTPRDVFEPADFGDAWTKRIALWGEFRTPERGPYVQPLTGKLALESTREERARTPAGFARAFFKANP